MDILERGILIKMRAINVALLGMFLVNFVFFLLIIGKPPLILGGIIFLLILLVLLRANYE